MLIMAIYNCSISLHNYKRRNIIAPLSFTTNLLYIFILSRQNSNMRYLPCLLIACFLPVAIWAQTCTCEQKFKMVRHEMETNYPGFKDKVNAKTKAEYDKKTKHFSTLAKNAQNGAYCLMYLKEWLDFFKDGHVQIGSDATDTIQAKERIQNAEIINISPEKLKELACSKVREEGIFYSPDSTYKIAVMRNKNDFRDFVGVMIESKTDMWKPGQVKLEMKKVNDSLYRTILYYRDHSYRAHSYYYNGKSYDGGNWNKEGVEQNLNTDESGMEYGYERVQVRKLSDSILYIQIGTFNLSNAKAIDSIFTAYKSALQTTPNLIIDLRHNSGGGDAAYQPILPYIYTRPIKDVGNDILSTPDNMKRWAAYLDDPYMSDEVKASIRETLDEMKKNVGKFVMHAEDDILTLDKDEIEPYPKRVAILINHNCGSTTEQFLLAARQSSKVTKCDRCQYSLQRPRLFLPCN